MLCIAVRDFFFFLFAFFLQSCVTSDKAKLPSWERLIMGLQVKVQVPSLI